MSENKIKECILVFREYWSLFLDEIDNQRGKIIDLLGENMFVSGYNNLFSEGISTYNKKRYKRAIFYFEKALKEKKDSFQCLYNLALAYQADNRFDVAIEYYQKALALNSKDNDTIYNLGLCYLNKHEGELAEKNLKLVLDKNPNDYDAKMSYVLALVECERIDEAIEKTIEIVQSNRLYRDFTLTVAKYIENISFGEKDSETILKVIKLLNSYLKVYDENSNAYIQVSMCYGKIGNWDLALQHSLAALKLDPKSYEINSHTALVLYCSHNYDEALKYYNKALDLKPIKNFETHYNIALTYEKLERMNDLKKKLKFILKSFATHPNIKAVETLYNSHFSEEKENKKEEEKEKKNKN